MTVFFIVFLLVYGSMHLYLFMGMQAAGLIPRAAKIPVIIIFGFLLFCPMLIRYLETSGHHAPAGYLAWIGFLWMGWLLMYCAFSAAFDVARALLHLGLKYAGKDLQLSFAAYRTAVAVLILLSFSTAVYGFFEARDIRTEHVELSTHKLPAGVERLRILQISDVHAGLIIREERLKTIADAVQKAGPDIVVATGDLVDGQICAYNGMAEILADITPKYGKFAITGNHEFYAGLKESRCFIEDAGFVLLRGQRVNIGNIMTIAGVDDPAARQMKLPPTADEKDLFSGLPKERFRLLLKHRPSTTPASAGLFDLQLSGHVHKGQIFPFSILTWLYYPVQSGLADLGSGSLLYVSRGTGTWGPPIRVLSPPEVTVIDLIRKPSGNK